MKFISSVIIAALFVFAANFAYSQALNLNPNSININAQSDFGVNCVGGQIHDDGVPENGYGWNASAGDPSAFAQKFIPTLYPYKFSKFCINLTRTSAGVSTFTFKIVQWKCVNGMPTDIMDSTTVTATGIPVYPAFAFYDFVLPTTWANVTTAGDSVFLGIRYNPVTMSAVYVGSDETSTTPLWPGWATTAAGPWQAPAALWPSYRALLFRAEGGSAVQYAHDYGVTNFLSLPTNPLIKNTPYNIKARVQNFGTSAESNVPISFFVNGTQVGSSVNLSLPVGGVDSVSFPWTPTTTGVKNLMVVSQLGTDLLRANDTIRTTMNVVAGAQVTIFCDPLTTLGNWTLTSTGAVPWALQTAAYTNMVMPTNAVLPWMACNVDAAGSGSNSNAVATLTTGINCSGKDGVFLEFDQDFYVLSGDQAIIDYSTNGGSSWINIATWTASHRTEHATIPMPAATNMTNVKLRFSCIQPGYDWWWALDNICVKGYPADGISSPVTTPVAYALSQNFPNPFNPTTQIKYSIRTNGLVTIKVYDILGKEVTTLVNEVKNAGTHIIDFNGANLSSGTYIYKMESNGFTDVKRMILIK
ncbi:MAG: T9SS type A sorting domain-containing protein [Ignavibacteria bacterium]|nr:T9SS type A sorting domain-containing protein [Ignavibacteria bacterium]